MASSNSDLDIFLILPHQLFETKHLNKFKKCRFILWEHPHYFKKYKYNKKRLLLHHGSMQYYYDYLKSKKYKVDYVALNESIKFDGKKYYIFDPIDKIKLPGKPKIIESPNFLLKKEDYEKYRKKTKKFTFYYFYQWGKKLINIIPNVKSKDKQNRKSLPSDIKIPKIPSNNSDKKYISKGKTFVDKNFKGNYGKTKDFMFPLTHSTAKKWLNDFIKKKFNKFGDYQDAIDKNNEFLFHSMLSSSINIGLLNPLDIIDKIKKYKSKIPINSYEGYIRQLFWREYQRYCYIYINFNNKNYFGNKKKLTEKWYNGTTKIKPLDDSIKSAFNNGYLHHIERLMIVGNFMNLSGISPKEGFKWFMEFACDSYEWVMHQNVLDMVFFVNGDSDEQTMRKPYISSSNYILKMSNYSKGEWCDVWDKLYYDFLKKHKKKLWKFRYYFPGLKSRSNKK